MNATRRTIRRLAWACMLPPLLLAGWLALHHVQSEREELEVTAQNLGRGLANAVDLDLRARISGLQMLAASPLISDTKRHAELYQNAQGYRLSFGSHVVLADLDMHMLFNTRAPFGAALPDLPRPKGHSAVQVALQTSGPAVGDVFPGPVAKESLVAIALPVQRANRSYLLLAPFETRQFDALLNKQQLPEGWTLRLRDGAEQLIAQRGPRLSPQELQGAYRYQFASELGPWTTVVEIPARVHQSHTLWLTVQMAVAVALAALFGLLAARWAGRRLEAG